MHHLKNQSRPWVYFYDMVEKNLTFKTQYQIMIQKNQKLDDNEDNLKNQTRWGISIWRNKF